MLDINKFPIEWNVIPAGKGKKYPEIKWDKYKEEKYPRSALLEHEGNVAVICGKTSNNLFAVDLDYKSRINDIFRERAFSTIYNKLCAELPSLAKTRVHKTPHGHHILYYLEDVPQTEHYKNLFKGEVFIGCILTKFHEFLDGIDIQGDKALAIIPPSNIDDLEYKVYIDEPIRSLNMYEFEELKDFFLLNEPMYIRKAFMDIINGKVNIHELKVKTGKDEHVYWKMLYAECYWRLHMLPEDLFKTLALNQPAFNQEKTEVQLKHVDFNTLKPMTSETYEEYFPMYIRKEVEVTFEREESNNPKDMNVKQLTDLVANMILEEFDIITLNDSRQLMLKNGSYYDFNLDRIDSRIKEICDIFSKGSYTSYKTNVMALIKDCTLTNRELFCIQGDLINFKNGIYDVMNEVLIEPKDFKEPFFYCIPWEYHVDESYDCPAFKKAINSWVMKEVRKKILWKRKRRWLSYRLWTPIRYDDIFEMIGLCLSLNTSFKKAFLNFGPTHSGKTQFLNLVIYLVGKDNFCSVKLHRLTKNEFGTKRLQNKLLNACGEIPNQKIKYTDLFKELTGDDFMVPSEIKGGEQFEFKCFAKFWFNANNIPPLDYIEDDAFFERFILIEFPNQFRQETEEFELQFWESLTDDYEIQGILHEAMKGLKRLIERKGFRKEITSNTKHVWLMESDPVYDFVNKCCDKKKGSKILADELYEFYNENGKTYLSTRQFTIELEKHNIYKRQLRANYEDKQKSGKERPYYYINVKLKDDDFEETSKMDIDKILFKPKVESITEEDAKKQGIEIPEEYNDLTPQQIDDIKATCYAILKPQGKKMKEKWINNLIKEVSNKLSISLKNTEKAIINLIEHGYLIKNYKDECYYDDTIDEKIKELMK